MVCDCIECRLKIEPVKRPGFHQYTLVGIRGLAEINRTAVGRGNHLPDRKTVFLGKLPVTLIVRGYRHDGTFAIAHQHKIRGIDRHPVATDRMDRLQPGIDAFFLHRLHGRFRRLHVPTFFQESGELRVTLCRFLRQWMFRSDGNIADAHQGIRTRGKHLQRLRMAIDTKGNLQTPGTADPVGLHRTHLLGPSGQRFQVFQQLVGIGRNLHEPLRDFLALHDRVATPAAAVDHLFVGQYRHVMRTPVDRCRFLVHEAFFEQPREQPLFPAIVPGVTGCQFACPVITESEPLQLAAHVIDVFIGPAGGRHIVLDRRVFGWQAEGVPAHRLQHILAQHALITGDHIAYRVVTHMAHVQFSARIREHGQAIELFPGGIFRYGKGLIFLPVLLGFRFKLLGIIGIFHHIHWLCAIAITSGLQAYRRHALRNNKSAA